MFSACAAVADAADAPVVAAVIVVVVAVPLSVIRKIELSVLLFTFENK